MATLPAPVDASGNGTTRWPQGTIVNLTRTYEARLHAEKEGQPIPSFARRLRFDRVPLAITTRDRLLRIQFALAEQGLFTEKKYSVKVYLAAQGAEFGANPSFSVSAEQIAEAYPNTSVWWKDVPDGSSKSKASWVTRKIDAGVLPPGTDASIRRQGFEIGTILGGYPKVKVEVVSEETGVKLAEREGVVPADGDWSEIIGKVNDQVRKAAGHFVPEEPILPQPGSFDPAKLFTPLGGLTFRALYAALERQVALDVRAVKGLIDGFKDSIQGDAQVVVMLGKTVVSPLETAKAFYAFLKEFVGNLGQMGGIQGVVNSLLEKLHSISFTEENVYYYGGYVVGFVFEQVVVAVILTLITEGIGAVVTKAAQLIQGIGWVAKLTAKAQALTRSLAYALKGASRVVTGNAAAKATLAWLKEIGPALEQLWAKYPNAGRILERAGEAAQVSKVVAQRALYWLTVVDRMTEEAAMRFVVFFEKKTAEVGERWLAKWTALRNGRKAVKDGFEAYDRTGEAAEGVHDALVVASDLNPPDVPTTSYPRSYSDKYKAAAGGNRVETSLERLRRDASDTRFDDEAVGETVKFHSRADVPPMSDDAIEGTARLANIPCTRVAAMTILAAILVVPGGCGKVIPDSIANHYPDLLPRFEKAMENLKHANDVAADESFARLFWAAHNSDPEVAPAVIRAASFPNASPQSVAEYMKAVDWMRDPGNPSSIITGLLDQAETQLGSSVNMKRVGNLGVGSLAEGWEPVAIERLIEGGSPNLPRPFARGDISSFGQKLDVSLIPPGSPGTIEADCLLKDGTFFDMKHSMRADPKITESQIDVLTRVLSNEGQRPIKRAVFVANAPVGQPILDKVRLANNALKQELGITEDLIYVIEDLGGFPLP